MPNFRCEFKVTSDLVLSGKSDSLTIEGADGNAYIFSNADADDNGYAPYLIVTVIGPAPSLDEAQEHLRSCLAKQLDIITFATHSRCMIEEPIRLVEWDAGKKERLFKVFHTVDGRYPPEPNLSQEFLSSSSIIDHANPDPFVRTALKYFRYGVLDKQPEDQFMRFWLALEIIAENVKENEPISIVCPECNTAMICNKCGTEPQRMPMAKQAIEQLIERIIGVDWRDVSKRQFIVRNGLMHGSSVESIEKKCKRPLSDLANELATLVWIAIRINIKLTDEDASKLVLGYRGGNFLNMSIEASVNGSFEHTGDTLHPAEDRIPSVKVSLLTKFEGEQEK